MENTAKTPKKIFAATSLITLAIAGMPWGVYLPNGWGLTILFVSMVSGLLVAVGIAEDILVATKYLEFQGFRYVCGLVLALATYKARMNGLDDVNGIFHVDPGALPMTVWAATAMNLIGFLFYVLIGCWILSFVVILRKPAEKGQAWKKVKTDWPIVAVTFAAMLAWMFILMQLDEVGRKQKLYLIAQASDFNSKFSCGGFDSTGLVALFIGPDQRRALLAPEFSSSIFKSGKPMAFDKIKYPDVFPIIECVAPSIDWVEWKKVNAVKGGPHSSPLPSADHIK
jgi:hypothetical protein